MGRIEKKTLNVLKVYTTALKVIGHLMLSKFEPLEADFSLCLG